MNLAVSRVAGVFLSALAPLQAGSQSEATPPRLVLQITVDQLRGDLPRSEGLAYAAVQILGGVLGTVVAHLMFELLPIAASSTVRTGGAPRGSQSTALSHSAVRPAMVSGGGSVYIGSLSGAQYAPGAGPGAIPP